MIRSLLLDNYRGFKRFEVRDLGRVNLIVGTNNSGKTSVLDAVNMLVANGEFSSVWGTLWRRGEDFEDREGGSGRHMDVRRLFHGHEFAIGNMFSLSATTDKNALELLAEITEPRQSDDRRSNQPQLFDLIEAGGEGDLFQPSALTVTWHGEPPLRVVTDVSRRGGISSESLRRAGRQVEVGRPSVRFITASSLSPDAVIELFEDVVLTADEELVVKALNIIEPSIERLATSGTERWRGSPSRNNIRGGLLLRCRGISDRIPIGSMGDGIWRLLGLALCLVRSEGGILLVDEIDTGLHYSVMEKMWQLVAETARRLKIQVFATTHSRDCYESLAVICREDVTTASDVTIQRIERGKGRAVVYSEQEIVAAARRGMEVR